MRNRWVSTERKEPEFYRGIAIHADSGVHEQAIRTIQRHVPPWASIVDIGAGAGAFSARLTDLGYSVTALDVDVDEWALDTVPVRHLDINRGIASSLDRTYDAACVLEVIEHIETPWHLLRELRAVVRPGGWLIISTPNVASFLSRTIFLVSGRFPQFDVPDLEYGHISPMTPCEIGNVAERTGWTVRSMEPAGYLPVVDLSVRTLRSLVWNALRVGAYAIARGEKRGWCTIAVLQNPA